MIIVKRNKVAPPSNRTLRRCFDSNPDGAGFMFLTHKGVVVRKGFMTYKALRAAHTELLMKYGTELFIVYHFRLATHGATDAGNTHPFPLIEDIKKGRRTEGIYPRAMVHNGIFLSTGAYWSSDHSDTQVFIRDVLSDKNIAKNIGSHGVQALLHSYMQGQKVVILDASGSWWTFGEGWRDDEKTGLSFSNLMWKYMGTTSWRTTQAVQAGVSAWKKTAQGAYVRANQKENRYDNTSTNPVKCTECKGSGWGRDETTECIACNGLGEVDNILGDYALTDREKRESAIMWGEAEEEWYGQRETLLEDFHDAARTKLLTSGRSDV
ncbi:MAG: hypothetical protein J3T61_00605 [Candidatus Brocadiales bacterium]|nr:hypothetical protein [Candidatus Bathyanammoxibius sp.]